jgi:hypothetical protein
MRSAPLAWYAGLAAGVAAATALYLGVLLAWAVWIVRHTY